MGGYNLRGIASFDGSAFEAGVNRMGAVARVGAQKISASFSGAITQRLGQAFAAGAVVTTLEQITRRGFEAAAAIKDFGEANDVTNEETQKLQRIADDAGLSLEDFGTILSTIGDKRKDAVKGNVELRKTFEGLNITVGDLMNPAQRNIDLLTKMGDAMKGIKLTPQQRADLRDLLGRKGDKAASAIQDLPNVNPAMFRDEDIAYGDMAAKKAMRLSRLGGIVAVQKFKQSLPGGIIGLWDAIEKRMSGKTGATTGDAPPKAEPYSVLRDPINMAEDKKHMEALAAFQRKFMEIEFEKLSTTGKLRDMKKEILELEQMSAELNADVPEQAMEQERLRRRIEIKKQEMGLLQKTGAPVPVTGYSLNERQRLGAFGGDALAMTNKQQVTLLEKMLDVMAGVERNTGRNSKKGAPIRVR